MTLANIKMIMEKSGSQVCLFHQLFDPIIGRASLKFSEDKKDLGVAKHFELAKENFGEAGLTSQDISRPEHTPEVSKSMSDQRIPQKKELTKNITK